jgi:hypothetical protein
MRGMTGVAAAIAAFLAASLPSSVHADHNGNGSFNHNAFSINSPTTNRGRQIGSNANAGGINSTRNAFCKKVRLCRIHQAHW